VPTCIGYAIGPYGPAMKTYRDTSSSLHSKDSELYWIVSISVDVGSFIGTDTAVFPGSIAYYSRTVVRVLTRL